NQILDGERIPGYGINESGLLIYQTQDGLMKLWVPQELRMKVLTEGHDNQISGHLGIERTLELMSRKYYWNDMKKDVQEYVRTCEVCQQMKPELRAQKGLLQPIPVADKKWDQITTDLVTDLPPVDGFDSIAVFVDRLTKMVKFIPCSKTIDAPGYARIFFDHIFRNHGIPSVIISDRDTRFTSKFWQELMKCVGTKVRMSTAFHPQTDGQSEVSIRTLENFLRPYVEDHPETWMQGLGMAEFAANNAVHTATGYSPFYLMYGVHPQLPGDLLAGKAQAEAESVQEMISHMQEVINDAKDRYKTAQEKMRQQANKRRRDVQFQVGEKVLLSTKTLNLSVLKHIPVKIRRRYIG
ncbi:integrase zinc binding domain-containing protein, partial [Devosia indica]